MWHLISRGNALEVRDDGDVCRRKTVIDCTAPFVDAHGLYVNVNPDTLPDNYTYVTEPARVEMGDALVIVDDTPQIIARYVQLRHPKGKQVQVASLYEEPGLVHDSLTLTYGVLGDGRLFSRVWTTDGDRSTIVESQEHTGWSTTGFQDSLKRSIMRRLEKSQLEHEKKLSGLEEGEQ